MAEDTSTQPGGAAPEAPARSGAGRRPGVTTTRDRILEAARQQFAERGFAGTTIRSIATASQVDPALVHHFFGSKDALFGIALRLPDEVAGAIPALLCEGLDGAGERLARFYLGLWEDPRTRTTFLAVFRSAVTHEHAAAMLRDVVSARLLAGGGPPLPDQARLRLTLAMSHLTGLAFGRYVMGVPPLAGEDAEYLVAAVAPCVQHYLTGELPGRPPAAGTADLAVSAPDQPG